MSANETFKHGSTVTLDSVSKSYESDTWAVRDVSMSINPGEFITLLGPSGSGKTTTLMMVAGFESVTKGDVLINNMSVSGLPACKRNIGMVFQNYALFPHLTVYENVAFPLKIRKLDKASIRAAVMKSLDLVHLREFSGRYPKQLSGGQQQRVALARATVFSPSILLMDEPLGALDRQLRQIMQIEIKKIQKALGVTVICVTHDQEEALTMSDRIAVMNNGLVAQIGTPDEIYKEPRDEFVAGFVGETNLVYGTALGRTGKGTRILLECGLDFDVLCEVREGDRVALSIRPEDIRILRSEDENKPNENTFDGTIVASAYSGATTRVVMAVKNREWIVRTDNVLVSRQQKISCCIDPKKIHLIK
jgi:putative spermidine/putrescine transport system ATP-binding protein